MEIAKRGQIQDSRYGFEVKRTSPAGWPMSGDVWVQLGDRECRDPTESHQGYRAAGLPDAPNFPLRQVLQTGAASSVLLPHFADQGANIQIGRVTCQGPLWVKSSVFSAFGTLPPCLIPPNFLSAHHFRDERKRGSAGVKPRPALLFPPPSLPVWEKVLT